MSLEDLFVTTIVPTVLSCIITSLVVILVKNMLHKRKLYEIKFIRNRWTIFSFIVLIILLSVFFSWTENGLNPQYIAKYIEELILSLGFIVSFVIIWKITVNMKLMLTFCRFASEHIIILLYKYHLQNILFFIRKIVINIVDEFIRDKLLDEFASKYKNEANIPKKSAR